MTQMLRQHFTLEFAKISNDSVCIPKSPKHIDQMDIIKQIRNININKGSNRELEKLRKESLSMLRAGPGTETQRCLHLDLNSQRCFELPLSSPPTKEYPFLPALIPLPAHQFLKQTTILFIYLFIYFGIN